jgi:hypothetical protein
MWSIARSFLSARCNAQHFKHRFNGGGKFMKRRLWRRARFSARDDYVAKHALYLAKSGAKIE